jgi:hypothetical protein
MPLREDVDFVGEAGIKWQNSHKRVVLSDDPPAVCFLLLDYIAEKTAALLSLVFSGRIQFSLKLRRYERKGIDLPVGMGHSHPNNLTFILEFQDILDLRPVSQLLVARLPESYQFNYVVNGKLS